MNVTTPHSLPDGVSSSAGMNASTAADKNAASGAVSVRYASGSLAAAGAAAGLACCACAGSAGVRLAATAVPAPPESCDVGSD